MVKCLLKCTQLFFFQKKKNLNICEPTLPKIFRPVTQNTLIFLFGRTEIMCAEKKMDHTHCQHDLKNTHQLSQFIDLNCGKFTSTNKRRACVCVCVCVCGWGLKIANHKNAGHFIAYDKIFA